MNALIHALRLEYNPEAGYQEAFAILSLGPVAVKPFVAELTQMMESRDREVSWTVDVALGCVKNWIGHSPREVAPFIAELKRCSDPEVKKWVEPRFP